jgi:hypothetical protein
MSGGDPAGQRHEERPIVDLQVSPNRPNMRAAIDDVSRCLGEFALALRRDIPIEEANVNPASRGSD